MAVVPNLGSMGVHKISKFVLLSIGGVYGLFAISYRGSMV